MERERKVVRVCERESEREVVKMRERERETKSYPKSHTLLLVFLYYYFLFLNIYNHLTYNLHPHKSKFHLTIFLSVTITTRIS